MKDYKTISFLTCGHVDDGKSTLIGRLLHDIGVVPTDHVAAAKDEGGQIDYALFTDGLEDERKQGITIDVAYRYFRFEGCRYRIADTPGHLEYMRNMAVAAVTSDIAVILVDAIHGVRYQTVEYSKIAKFFGVRQFLVAINKMDAVEYSKERYDSIKKDYLEQFGEQEDEVSIEFVPVSAIEGDNIISNSERTPWYEGPTMLSSLQNAKQNTLPSNDLRFPVQFTSKDADGLRWYFGTLRGQELKVGDKLVATKSQRVVTLSGIVDSGLPVEKAEKNSAIAISVVEDVDLSRGTVLSSHAQPGLKADAFYADLLWVDKRLEGKANFQGLIKLHHAEAQVQVQIDEESLKGAGKDGVLKSGLVHLSQEVALDPFVDNPHTGLFILIDSNTDHVAGVGTVKRLIEQHYQGAASI